MKIAPIDIAHKTFDRKLSGIDAQQVYDFLKDVADQMEAVVRERNLLKDQLRERELQIMEYRERDETLKATITTATRMAEQMKIEAEKEGQLILQDARQRAEIMGREARDSLKKCYGDINELKKMRMQFEANLRSVVQSHMSMLDQGRQFIKDPVVEVSMSNDINARNQQLDNNMNQVNNRGASQPVPLQNSQMSGQSIPANVQAHLSQAIQNSVNHGFGIQGSQFLEESKPNNQNPQFNPGLARS